MSTNRRQHAIAICAAASLWLGGLAEAEPRGEADELRGRLTTQGAFNHFRANSAAALEEGQDQKQAFGNARLMYSPSQGNWNFDVHYLVAFEHGDDIDEVRRAAGPPATWLDLTDSLAMRRRSTAQQSIDRLSIGYSAPGFVVRFGRQALSWGSGYVFRPMDIINPFAPTAIDTEYKPGTEMLYGQLLFADGSDLQAVAIPRGHEFEGRPTAHASTFALHARRRIEGLEMTLLVAQDHGDWTAAVAANGPLGGATWNLEIVPTDVDNSGIYVSALANLSTAALVFGHNMRLFGEYFHNGFGVRGRSALSTLPPHLMDRLARGQAFVATRDFVAVGATVECNPLLTFAPTAIVDLQGQSLDLLAALNWSLGDNTVLVAGVQLPLGRRGTEFGGIPLEPDATVTSSPPSRAYAQLKIYF